MIYKTLSKTKTEQTTIVSQIPQEIIKEFTLDCFLCHPLYLRRNWGSGDDKDHLPFKNVTLLQFKSRSGNFQIVIQPKTRQIINCEVTYAKYGEITIAHHTKRSKPLFDYFLDKLTQIEMRCNTNHH